jgi:hypothetical protein
VSAPKTPKPRLWPRYAVGPEGNRARFDCMGDVPSGWTLTEPLPGHPVAVEMDEVRAFAAANEAYLAPQVKALDGLVKRKPGRPRKVEVPDAER